MSSANSEPESVLARADRRPDRLPTRLNQGGALSAGVQHESAMPETGMMNAVVCCAAYSEPERVVCTHAT